MELPGRFGDYQLLERIAVGGMAEVFLAKSFGVEGFEKPVVIKRILPGLARSPRFISMFVKEAKISALLSHPNVVQVYELGRVESDYYIAMEYIHGRDLTRTVRKLRARGERMPMNLAVYVSACIARGLAYAHSRLGADGRALNIVHRDVSPHNVILSFQGQVKLLDFGIARLAGEAGEESASGRPGGGKYAYMSPEQASGRAIDGRSDLFSCGIVLYELLVNHRLFQHADPTEKLRRVREAIVPDPREEVPEIPERLWAILQRALARDPADRYADGLEMEEDLRAFLYEEGLRADEKGLADCLSELFTDELGPDPNARDLERMVRGLVRLDGERSLGGDGDHDSTARSLPVEASIDHTGLTSDSAVGLGTGPVVEKKPVAAVVAEVVGLTEFSEQVAPEDLLVQHRSLLRVVRRVVDRFGGWFERFDDDTLTVYFGLPRTQEDDPQRAMACARELARMGERLRRRGLSVELAVGVHRGEVAASGRGEALKILPRGDVLKLARRLASVAEPGQVLVSDRMASQSGERWTYRPGPPLRLKGHRTEQPCFVLQGRRRRAVGGLIGRWIRRADEIDRLAGAVRALGAGEGGFILIRGLQGAGKSRLVRELRELARRAGVPYFVGRSLPYGSESPLAIFRDLVAAVLGLEPTDDVRVVRSRLGRLSELNAGEAEIATIARLFAIDMKRGAPAPTQEAIMAAAVSLVRGLARSRPVILVIEDMHYAEARELVTLAHVMRSTADEPVLWLMTSRRGAGREFPDPDQIIRLGPLDGRGRQQLVADLLGAESVGPDLMGLVERTAEGNPLYIGEVVKALQQSRSVKMEARRAEMVAGAEPGLPPTLEGLIAARVDALAPAHKETLQLAATVGLSFSAALLGLAAGLEDPGPALRDLRDRGLIVREGSSAQPDRAPWTFSSHLVWEVVRRSVLGAQLRDHHQRIADGLEQAYAEHLEPHFEALARHNHAGGRNLGAARYAMKAGDAHREGAFLQRAASCYRQGLSYLEALRAGPDGAGGESGTDQEMAAGEGEALLNLRAGEVCWMLGEHVDAERYLQVALDVSEDLCMSDVELGCFLALGRIYRSRGRTTLAHANLEQGLVQAELSGDLESQVEFLEALGQLHQDQGALAEARRSHTRALELAEGHPVLQARALVGLAIQAVHRAEDALAQETLERALELATEAGDRILVGRCVNNLGALHYAMGRHEEALRAFRRALELRRGTGYRPGIVINLCNIGATWLRMGDSARAFVAFEEARATAREVGLERGGALAEVYLGYLDAERGQADGLARLRRARDLCERLGDRETSLAGLWLEARHYAFGPDPARGRDLLQSVLATARDRGMAWLIRDIEAELAQQDDAAGG